MAKPTKKKVFGLLAEYETPREIFEACEKVRDAGYQKWDSYTPFPVHNLDKAMGLKPSMLGWLVFVCGISGSSGGMLLQWWTSTIEYPIIIAAKPYFSYQAFVPVTFELGILLASFAAVFGMLAFNRLPQWYHSCFNSERFARVTDDKFFICIESTDPKYSLEKTRSLLEATGAAHIEEVED